MHRGRRTAAAAALATAALAAAPAAASAAEALYGVTDQGRVITLNSSAPGNVERSVAIRGLQPGESIVGIDVRPVNDLLYALGSTSRIYILNPASGAVRAVGSGTPFTPALNGTSFGFDFNPTVDRIRITSDTAQNLRANPDTGAVAAVDGVLGYAPADAGAGTVPSVGGSGYSNSFPGTATTQLFDIDTARDTLVLQNPPNSGTLNTVGPLGVAVSGTLGFDVGAGNVGYAAMRPTAADDAVNLYRIDLQSGRATPAGETPAIGTQDVVALAAAGTVEDDRTDPTDSVAVSSTQSEARLLSQGLRVSVSADEAASVSATVEVAGRQAGTATATISDRAGRAGLAIRLSAAARAAIRRPGSLRIALEVTVTDTAGNDVTQRRAIRTR